MESWDGRFNIVFMWRLDTASLQPVCMEPDGQSAERSQLRSLLNLLRRFEATPFGQAHGFDEIDSVAEFQDRVPLQRSQIPRNPKHERELLPVAPCAGAAQQLGNVARLVSASGGWLDLEYCVRQRAREHSGGQCMSVSTVIESVIRQYSAHPVEVLVSPTAWLGTVLSTLRSVDTADTWARLRLVIATASTRAVRNECVEHELTERFPNTALLHAYQTPDGIIAALETHPGSRVFRLLVSAGVFFEFVEIGPYEPGRRVSLRDAQFGRVYEVCVSTKRGLFGFLTGLQVIFIASHHGTSVPSFSNRSPQSIQPVRPNIDSPAVGFDLDLPNWNRDEVFQC